MDGLTEALIALIRRAATDLPPDVEAALRDARQREEPGAPAETALATILRNVALARERATPLCQDTGLPTFYVHHPPTRRPRALRRRIERALVEATQRAYLRPNAVDPVSGRNSGDNVGDGFPQLHFTEWDREAVQVDLLLKGGGCENVSAQYKLPHPALDAGRDWEGVRRVVLEAIHRAQGRGCAPGVLGVAIGGDRAGGYGAAKAQFLRPLPDASPVPALAALERRLLRDANALGIGAMGFGGRVTLLGVKVAALHRLPACYFVSVSYGCWALRRARLTWRAGDGRIHQPGGTDGGS
jgi:fumarate hydratase class I